MLTGARSLSALLVWTMLAALVMGSAGCAAITGQRATDAGTPDQAVSGMAGVPPTSDKTLAQAPPGGAAGGEREAVESGSAVSAPTVADRLVIRTKSMSLEVDDARKAAKSAEALAKRFGGYLTDVSITSDGGVVRPLAEEEYAATPAPQTGAAKTGPFVATVTMKVPVARLEALVAESRKLGDVETEREEQQDVTQQHVDLKARLKNLEAEEKRFVRFFDAATTVKDMLAIERELSRVRGEIESHKAQIDHLESNAAMGTLTLEMHEPRPVVSPAGPGGWGVVRAFTQAIRNFVDVVNFLIMLTGAVLPFLILALAAWLVVRWVYRQMRRRPAGGDTEDAGRD